MKKLEYWFWYWKLRGYPVSALLPNWYKNLSVHWSKKEQRTQQALGVLHVGIGNVLIKVKDKVDWGDEVEYRDGKLPIPSWQQKLYDEEGIIL